MSTSGALAAAAWLGHFGPPPPANVRWHVEIAFDVLDRRAPTEFDETSATRFHLDVYREEWGVYFCHGGRGSWIRVTDVAFVHGRDDFSLLGAIARPEDAMHLLRRLEAEHRIAFRRAHAAVHTNLPSVERAIRRWLSD